MLSEATYYCGWQKAQSGTYKYPLHTKSAIQRICMIYKVHSPIGVPTEWQSYWLLPLVAAQKGTKLFAHVKKKLMNNCILNRETIISVHWVEKITYLTTKNAEKKLLQSWQLLQYFNCVQIFGPLYKSFINEFFLRTSSTNVNA